MPSDPKREPLPFEPKSNKQSSGKTKSSSEPPASSVKPTSQNETAAAKTVGNQTEKADLGIPDVVSRRMVRRVTIFAGIPTFLGMSSFVVAYVLLTRHIVEFPNVVVLLVSLGFFGLGTLGLSYGVLSASWQEELEGSLLGISEFSVNFRRLIQGLRKPKQSSTSD